MHRLFVFIVTATSVVLAASPGAAQPDSGPSPARCADALADIAGAEAADFVDICTGAAASLRFLASHGVHATEPVSIEVTNSIPPEASPTAAGCYVERRRRVYVLPYAAFVKHKTWFGVAIDRSVYRALAAHEAAHAVAACNFRIPNPTIQAKEYLAYVATFSTMPASLRAMALKATKTEGFSSMDRFTLALCMFDPMRFAAESYQHFSKTDDQTGLIQSVLAGSVLTD